MPDVERFRNSILRGDTRRGDDDLREWPLFLSRMDPRDTGPAPPPLPRMLSYARAVRLSRQMLQSGVSERTARVMAGSALVAFMAGLSAMGSQQYPKSSPRLTGGPTPVIRANAVPAGDRQALNELTTAIETVAALESRLEFSPPRFSAYVDELRTTPEAAGETGDTDAEILASAATAESSSSVALLVLRNLPFHATFSEGASAGPGTWAMAAGDPNVLLETMKEGFEEPVVADVELISSAGRSVGFLRLPLRNNPVATANDIATRSVLALENPQAEQVQSRSRQRARIHDRRKIVRAEPQEEPRRTKDKAAREITAEAAPVDPSQLANADGAKPKPGLVSKFFSWLTSGTDDKSAADNGIRRGLGGPTDE